MRSSKRGLLPPSSIFVWKTVERQALFDRWVTSIMCHSAKVHAAGRSFGSRAGAQVWCPVSLLGKPPSRFGILRKQLSGILKLPVLEAFFQYKLYGKLEG